MNPDETPPIASVSTPADSLGRLPIAGLRSAGGLGANFLPPIGVLLARPLLLGLCALLGAIGGFLFTVGDKGSAATATIEFAVLPNAEVALEGATLQRTIAPAWVLQKAATSLGEQPNDLAPQTTVVWQQGTRLLNVTATAATGEQAVKIANTVAEAAVAAADEARNQRLNAAVQQANSALLEDAPLADSDAEVARRNQIGATLGELQNKIKGESMSLIVASPAAKAMPAGLSTKKGIVVGLASGLLAGAIIAVLLGSRGLRIPAAGAMRRLAPDVEVMSPSDLPRIAGQLIEAGETLVVVIATHGASLNAQPVTQNLQRLLAAHGKSVTIASSQLFENPKSIALLTGDAPYAAGTPKDTDITLLNVDDGTEAASMFEGRTGFGVVIVGRRGKTPLSTALGVNRLFARTEPFLVVVS